MKKEFKHHNSLSQPGSPLPFPCVPDRPYKILLVRVGTLKMAKFGVAGNTFYAGEQGTGGHKYGLANLAA